MTEWLQVWIHLNSRRSTYKTNYKLDGGMWGLSISVRPKPFLGSKNSIQLIKSLALHNDKCAGTPLKTGWVGGRRRLESPDQRAENGMESEERRERGTRRILIGTKWEGKIPSESCPISSCPLNNYVAWPREDFTNLSFFIPRVWVDVQMGSSYERERGNLYPCH